MFNRVLIMSASAGNGHVRAAEALEKAFVQSDTAKAVTHIDALAYASPLVRRLYSNTYIEMVNKSPALLGILYDAADKPWWEERRRLAFHRMNAWPLITYIETYDPDLIVCTHPLPADIVSFLICHGRLHSRHAVVVTDFDMHGMWLTRHCDHYFTAIDETKEHLIRLGAAPSKVAVTGIPIDPKFNDLPPKHAAGAALGLVYGKTTIMVSAGGFGVGRVSELIEQLVKLDEPAQILAMCGKNSHLKERLAKTCRELNERGLTVSHAPSVIPVGYVRNMHEYMAASDLMVGKPGGLTTSEALASDLVMVIVNPIPGQEERNADHLLEEGAAIRCNNLPALAYKMNNLLRNPERFAEMQKNVQRLAHPDAAMDIVRHLVNAQRLADEGTTSTDSTGKARASEDRFVAPHRCQTRRPRLGLRSIGQIGEIGKIGGTGWTSPVIAPGNLKLFRKPPEEAG
jgi:processive 1,2-diacylglycerol beta-glucosyltransferase